MGTRRTQIIGDGCCGGANTGRLRPRKVTWSDRVLPQEGIEIGHRVLTHYAPKSDRILTVARCCSTEPRTSATRHIALAHAIADSAVSKHLGYIEGAMVDEVVMLAPQRAVTAK